MGEATVSAGYANALVDYAVSQGATRDALLDRSDIDRGLFGDPDNRVPFRSYIRLMKVAKEVCRDPALALHFAAATEIDRVSVVGLICRAAPTMGEALRQVNRYSLLVTEVDLAEPGARFQIVHKDNELWLEDMRTAPNQFPELTESTFARFICMIGRHYPDAPFAKAVHVTHPKPEHVAEYERILGVPVTFESDRNAIHIDASWPTMEIENSNPYAITLLSERADALMADLNDTQTMRGNVEKQIVPHLHKGEVSMETVAKELGLSRQSLFRKLKSEATTFQEVLDDLRHRMAVHYLDSKKVSVNETAYLVGFADASGFSKAFKRWTGKNPGDVRRKEA